MMGFAFVGFEGTPEMNTRGLEDLLRCVVREVLFESKWQGIRFRCLEELVGYDLKVISHHR
jgi:hypothetical protein